MLSPIKNSSEYSSHIQNDQQDYVTLELTLKHHGKSALMAALNSGSYSQETLYLLLCSLCFKGKSDVVTMMFETKSYTVKMLANIVLDALVNSSAEFAVELLAELNDASFKTKVLDTALELAAGRGAELQDASHLIAELIHLGANSTRTALELANACDRPDADVIDYLNTTCIDSKLDFSVQEHASVQVKSGQAQFINSTQIPAEEKTIPLAAILSSANPLPADVWLFILSFLSTKQELAPIRLVSSTFKAYADHPVLAAIPYAELDYSSPLVQKIKSFDVGFDGFRPECFITLSGSAAMIARGNTLCHYDVSDYQQRFLRSDLLPARKTLTGHTGKITAMCDFKKGIVISSSNDMTIRVWNIEEGECINVLRGHKATVIGLAKLNGSLIASTSTDKTIRIWDIEKGECVKLLDAHTYPARQIIKLPQENLILTLGPRGISRWDIKTAESQHRSLPTGIKYCSSIDLLSDDQVILNCDSFVTVASISSLFAAAPLGLTKRIITYENMYFKRICLLPNGYIACLITAREWGTLAALLLVYDLNERKVILTHEIDHLKIDLNLGILADQRIAIWGAQLQIIPFGVENENVVPQKNPDTEELTNQNCVIS